MTPEEIIEAVEQARIELAQKAEQHWNTSNYGGVSAGVVGTKKSLAFSENELNSIPYRWQVICEIDRQAEELHKELLSDTAERE